MRKKAKNGDRWRGWRERGEGEGVKESKRERKQKREGDIIKIEC